MLKSFLHDIALAVQAKSGVTPNLLVTLAIVAFAGLTAFAFLCVAGFEWLALQIGSVFAGLVMAGIFVLIALLGLLVCALQRRRARERAILERAARAHAPSWLLDPKILATAVQVGRTLGWQRIVPVALLGFMAAQWTREYRAHGRDRRDRGE
jgi:Na+/proline symporter